MQQLGNIFAFKSYPYCVYTVMFPFLFDNYLKNMVVTGTGLENEDGTSANIENMWCDLETQRFYRDLPELQAFLPTCFINKSQTPPPTESTVTEETLDSELPAEELEDDGEFLILLFTFVAILL